MRLKLFTILLVFGLSSKGIAQVNPSTPFNSKKEGVVNIYQDESIRRLLDTYIIANAARPGMQGFRVRIYFDLGQQSRTTSLDEQTKFMETMPGINVYRTFDSPYYKVSVGDFRTRDEALKLLKSIEKQYPKAFIVSEWIHFPKLN